MTKFKAIALCLCSAVCNSLALPPIYAANCLSVNGAVDRDVASYNADMIKNNEATADVADFLQDFEMTLLWFTLPFKANLYATNGLMTLGNLSRSDDVIQCSNSSSQTLQGVVEYDDVRVSYDITGKFYRWQTEGSISCSFGKPSVSLLYTKGDSLGCRIASYNLNSSGKRECRVITDSNSWSAWLVGKALHYALLSKQPGPDSMVLSFLQASRSMIETNFGNHWC